MTRTWFACGVAAMLALSASVAPACCPAPPHNKPVVNADQTVIILWDPISQTQHFIRQASFKSAADDFGFIVPSPSEPELNESGNEAFPVLSKVTEPEIVKMPRPGGGISCGCGGKSGGDMRGALWSQPVKVLQEKMVAGFNASVLEAQSADALVGWLKDNGFAFSPEVKAWAEPYIAQGWKFTALKVAKKDDAKDQKDVAAAALRITFKTDRPLFPYREPDTKSASAALGATSRMLRIYFIGEARYQGELTKDSPWTGKVAWSGKMTAEDKKKVLAGLKLPETTGPAEWWLTEFEDEWPYRLAPADLTFTRSSDQGTVKREPHIQYVSSPWPDDLSVYAIAAIIIFPPLLRRFRAGG